MSTRWIVVSVCAFVYFAATVRGAPLVDLQLRAVSSLSSADTAVAPPTSISDVSVGGTMYLELWLKDIGSPLQGISGAYVDIAYDTARFDALAVSHGGLYTNFTAGTIQDPSGLVYLFGGNYLDLGGTGRPGRDSWARLGSITFQRTAGGSASFIPQETDDEFSRFSGGAAPWSSVNAPTLTVPEPTALIGLLVAGALALLRRPHSSGRNPL